MTKLLHIGLGKAGSTTLQREIFPVISDKLDIPFYHLPLLNIYDYFDADKKESLKNNNIKTLPNKFIVTSEILVGANLQFHEFEAAFNLIKERFSSNTEILIIIRKPSELFNSIYVQSIHELKLFKEKDFFINIHPDKIDNKNKQEKYNLYGFSYEKLIEMYKSYFNKVHVVRVEKLHELNFLNEIFSLNDEFKIILKEKINKKWNRSFSKFGVNLCFFLNNFFDLKKFDLYIESKLNKKNPSLFDKIKNRLLSQFLIRGIIQYKIDKINFLYKKYKINKKNLPIDVDKLDRDYENLPF